MWWLCDTPVEALWLLGFVGCDTPVDVLCLLGFVGVWLGWVCVLVGVRVSYSSCCRLVSGWGWFPVCSLAVFGGLRTQ